MTGKSCFFVMMIATCILLMFVIQLSHASPFKRSTGPQICSRSTPCGWEVYRPYVRTVSYFVASPCSCPPQFRCVRTSDDVSISAYVHRCRHIEGETLST